jgi:DNA-directed RNA polymerase
VKPLLKLALLGCLAQRQHIVTTVLQRLVLRDARKDMPILKRRQRSAFPPNYIHSLDSTHMMLTALACKDAGLFKGAISCSGMLASEIGHFCCLRLSLFYVTNKGNPVRTSAAVCAP